MPGSPNISNLFHPENHQHATLHCRWPLLFANTTQVPVTAALGLSDKIQLIRRRKRATSVNNQSNHASTGGNNNTIHTSQLSQRFIPRTNHTSVDSHLTPIIPHMGSHTRKTDEGKSQKASAMSTGRWQHSVKSDVEAEKGNK